MSKQISSLTVKAKARVRKTDKALLVNADASSAAGLYDITPQRKDGAATRLSMFLTALKAQSNIRRINLRIIGTSMVAGVGTCGNRAMVALQKYLGDYGHTHSNFNEFSDTRNGWKGQYYSGPLALRLRGNSGEGATAITYSYMPGVSSIAVSYSVGSDGGNIAVETRVGGQGTSWTSAGTINCNNASSDYGRIFEITGIDKTKAIEIRFTPPASGYGYLEFIQAYTGNTGAVLAQLGAGGIGINQYSGLSSKSATGGMATSDTPNGNKGLIANFSPSNANVKPDLIFYSGPTNDFNGGAANFVTSLTDACALAVANGTSLILSIEPVNGTASNGATGNWATCRDAFYAMQDAYPENVFVHDFDQIKDEDLQYNTRIHNGGDTTHLGITAYGDPDYDGAIDLLNKLGVPLPKEGTQNLDAAWAAAYSSATEPTFAPIGSAWLDTSVSPNIPKKLVAYPFATYTRGKGMWEFSGTTPIVFRQAAGNKPASATDTTDRWGCYGIIPTAEVTYDLGALTLDAWYTLQLRISGAADSYWGYSIDFGGWPRAIWSPTSQSWSKAASGGNNSGGFYFNTTSHAEQLCITFKTPTSSERTALDIGTPTNFYLRFGRTQANGDVIVSNAVLSKGVSAIIPTF